MTDVDDLIKRLRAHEFVEPEEAADALQRIKDALEPFANRADQYDKMSVDDIKPSLVRDCIAARRALRGEGE